MKLVSEIFSINDNFEMVRQATIIFDKDKNTIYTAKGDEWILRPGGEFAEGGVVGEDQKRYFPKDGEKFIRALPVQFTGSRMRASLREEQ